MASRLKNLRINRDGRGAVSLPLLFGLFLLGLLVLWVAVSRPAPAVVEEIFEPAPPQPITLLLVGDIMMDRGVRSVVNKYFEGDYRALFAHAGYLDDADITFGNLEGTATAEISNRTGSRFSFRMAPESLAALKDAGFDIVSFANNHVGDYSTKGFLATLSNLKESGLLYAGAGNNKSEAAAPAIIDVRGTKIGFLAATDVGPDWLKASDTVPGILLASDPDLSSIIADAKSHVDVLVVSYHWGNEYSPVSARQKSLAQRSIDAGADIVVGHHPHVMQKFDYYNGKPIFYSLGNFIFDQYFSPFTLHGMIGDVQIDPETLAITVSARISPQDSQYVPKEPFPFEEKFLLTKSFTP